MAKLHFYYSAMNAGKSTVLLQSSHNYKERGMDTLLFTAKKDNRYGTAKITSRIGISADAVCFDDEMNIYEYVVHELDNNTNLSCVLVDEAQFLTKAHVLQLCDIADQINIPVLVYGIRTDFQSEPFPGSMYLLALADIIIEIKTICHCGSKATMNMRIDQNGKKVEKGKQVEIGGNDRYVPTCRKHFNEGISDRWPTKVKQEQEEAIIH